MRNQLCALGLLVASWMSAQNITGYEYWFNTADQDGQRFFEATGGTQVVGLMGLNIPLGAVPLGHHVAHYRLKDSNGRWSSVLSKPVTRLVGSPYEITGGEYWFDESTTRHPFSLGPGQSVSATIDPGVTGLAQGPHMAHYRLRDNHGFWSSVLSKPFTVLPAGPHQLVLLRYWSDPATTDPSDMTVVPITPAVQYLDIIDDVLFCNWSTTGQTNVYFQLKDNHAQWSSVVTRNYTVASSIDAPGQPAAIVGDPAPDFGSLETYSVAPVPGAAGYTWTLPDGWTGSSNTNSINVQVGNSNDAWQLCVQAYNGCGEGEERCMDISTSMLQHSGANGIALFPNPTSGQFTLAAETSITRVLIHNSTGLLVRELGNIGADRVALDLTGEAGGLYTVRVFRGEQHSDVRVVVQH